MPGTTAGHALVCEVADGVDACFSDEGGWFVGEGVEEEAFEGSEGLGGEVVVEGEAGSVWGGCVVRLGLGWAEEEAAEEDEGEGAHLCGCG